MNDALQTNRLFGLNDRTLGAGRRLLLGRSGFRVTLDGRGGVGRDNPGRAPFG